MSETTTTRPRLLLIDGHSLAYRAFYALPVENFSTATGQVTNAVYGFTSMLINVLRDEAPDHVAVAFDVSRQTFRTETYAEYKGNRSKSPEEFGPQVSLIKEVLAALRVPMLEKPGFEADDIIATLATQAGDAGYEVLICSGDRDTFQLVRDNVTVLYPTRGVSELSRMTPEAVEAKYGLAPERYPDLAALVGETSDNLPGIPGVGPKTAAKWVGLYGDLDGIVASADAIKGKAGQSLRDHLPQVLINRQVNHLVRDVDLPLAPADLRLPGWDREEVHQVFDGLEFRVLRERLFATLASPEPEAEEGFDLAAEKLTGTAVGTWLGANAGVAVGITVLGTWKAGHGDATGIAIAAPEPSPGQPGPAAFVNLVEADAEALAAVSAWLADASKPKVLHDAKGPLTALSDRGLVVEGIIGDTALAAYLCLPDQRSYDLADLTVRHLGRALKAEEAPVNQQLTLDMEETAGPDEAELAMVRARAVIDLWGALQSDLASRGAAGLLTDVELPLLGVLRVMEQHGIAIDQDALGELDSYFAAAVADAGKQAFEAIGKEINLGSPKQLQVVLFDELDMPKTKRTKTGYTTDAEALADLFVKTEHPFLAHLLRHRDATKLRQTVAGLLAAVSDDGRVHTTYLQTIAATGRLSSTDPNLQNIPVRTEEGRRIRETFVVGPDFECLLTADYSQIEMRIMAHLSEDEGLIEAFRSGEDLHRFVGSRVFAVEPADVTAAMRSKIKAMSYGLAYGLSAFGLSRQLNIPVDEAKTLMEDYFDRFGGVRDYLRGVVDEARRTGYTETILGRRRYLPDLVSDNRQRREMAERMALNAPIQGSAADIVKVAMLEVDRRLREQGLRSRMLLQVHDELVLEVFPGEREQVEALVREGMAGAASLNVPLDVSVGVGRSWHEAAH
ncbi:DNA polymerase I [Kineosporia succinea]|uniref:DNA polymerase I n=1 Tax=Kineosporia succinea TaxID=84632 RepID=A0ABT9PF16_9ACTN|nr:DNA polymerase I [Kineosporia succinea]MDP9831297.1 DNA polymerase-1 [Kineosporia succinea]